MSYNLSNIVMEKGEYWALRVKKPSGYISYEVYKTGVTHSTRCAIIGSFADGSEFERIEREIDRRIAQDAAQ